MLAYTLKPILELIPEAMPMVKRASIQEDFPLDSTDSVIASALEMKYHQHIDHKPVDPFVMDKVAQAVGLYGVKEQVEDLTKKMVKAAGQRQLGEMFSKENTKLCLAKQASFEGELSGMSDPLSRSEKALSLYKEASDLGLESSEPVLRYSGRAYLSKEAAISNLGARYHATKDPDFVKIAQAIGRLDTYSLKPETVLDICQTVSKMDKVAGLHMKGFDFFRDALLDKEAAISALLVTLDNKSYPWESIEKLGTDRIARFIGEDVAKEIEVSPQNGKQVLETLPLDLQKVMVNLLANV